MEWYKCRWIIEEYHKCLKTGCRIEDRQLGTSEALEAVLGVLGIIAVLMLQLRNLAREDSNRQAKEVVPEIPMKIICKKYKLEMTVSLRDFWRSVAKMGGFIGRKSDGEPGWQTLWGGWLRLIDMWFGVEAFMAC